MTHLGYVLKVFPRLSQTFIVHELRAQERAGLRLTVFVLRAPRETERNLVQPPLQGEVVYLEGPDDALAEQLAVAARARGITRLHAHFARLATSVARDAALALAIPYSFTAHARDLYDASVDHDALATYVRDATQVVTVSRFNVTHLAHALGRTPSLVYNGLPLDAFPYHDPSDRAPVLLAVGRLVEKKGFRYLLDACRLLMEAGVSFRCVIAGDGEERTALEAQREQLGLSSHVTLLGTVAPEAVPALMREAAALAVPCVVAASGDRDGLPSVLLEAMALGTPCIGTDVTGIPEAVIDGESGLLVRQRDVPALAAACRRLLEDGALRVRLARRARAIVERRFSSEANTRRLRALWGAAPLRVLFRVYNRRGLGHWMRGMNLARELLALDAATELCFFTRSAPPFPIDDPRIRHVVAATPDSMDVLPPEVADFAPDVIVDDTMPPASLTTTGARHVFIMRRCAAERQAQVFAHPTLAAMDAVLVPHTPAEFGYALPAALQGRAQFVGPIVRRAEPARVAAMRARLGLRAGDFCLLSTPGGGGFDEDSARFVDIVRRVHERLVAARDGVRHVLVLGPNSSLTVEPVDAAMLVVASEPEMESLIACADAVISAGGYNSVSEIRLAQRPAFYLPGHRTHDDQRQRVVELAARGLAVVVDDRDADRAADDIVTACLDAPRLARMRQCLAADAFEPGNRRGAEAIVACARC